LPWPVIIFLYFFPSCSAAIFSVMYNMYLIN
jgi:hypothetical protein